MADDRENVTIQVAGKSFTIDAPTGLSDDDILRKAMSADKEFAGLATTNERLAGLAAEGQARQRLPKPEYTSPEAKRFFESPEAKKAEYMKESGKFAAETAGGIVGAGAIGPVAGAASNLARPVLRWTLPTMIRAAGVGTGVGAGGLTAGEKPKEALHSAEGAAVGTLVLEPVFKIAGALIRPFLQKAEPFASETALNLGVSRRAHELATMADAEEGLRKSIVAAPRAIRKSIIDPLYPKVSSLVDIYPSARQAIESSGKQIAHGTPSELYRTKNIGRQIEQAATILKEQLALDASLRGAGLPGIEQSQLADTLQALQEKRSITFSQAQELRSALGKAIAKGQGYKVPAEVYHTLHSVHDLVDDAMRSAAKAEGVLPQWEHAQKVYRSFMDDFYNKNAPLKGVLDLKEGMHGATLRRLTRPVTGARAEIALRRWGLNDQADALRKVLDNPKSKEAIQDMEKLMTSPKGFKSAKLEEAKAADVERVTQSREELSKARGKRLKYAAGALGGAGAAYKGYQYLTEDAKP